MLFLHKLLSFVQRFVEKTKEQKFFDNLHEKEKKRKAGIVLGKKVPSGNG